MARLVFVTVPEGKREAVLGVLDDEEVEYSLSDETSDRDYDCTVQFPLPTNGVEPILERLRNSGVHDDAITVTVQTQSVVSREFEQLEERFKEAEESPEQIASEELQSAASDLVPASLPVYSSMTVVSAMIATAGLLLDSAAVVVGSMVIAPLIGPAMATSVGTIFREQALFRDGIKLQIFGLVLSVVSAALFAFIVKTGHFVPPGLDILGIQQIQERFRPDVLSLVIALGSGVAGIISLASGLSSALVGVMIAVALIPPAATLGIAIAWGIPTLAIGSGVLLLVNVLSINLAALVTLWYMGYRPSHWFQIERSRQAFLKRAGVLVLSILLLTVFLGAVTFSTYQTATAEQSIQAEIESSLAESDYSQLVLLDVDFEYSENLLAQRPSDVTIHVGTPPGVVPPQLAAQLDAGVDRAVGRDVDIQIRYVTVQQPDS